jgi:hypothetical protein
MFKNKAYMKMLIGSTLGVLIITSALCLKFQTAKIDKLEDELYLKQQNEQKVSDSYVSILNEKTIQTKLNTLHEYPILKDCEVNMEHTYNYTSEGRMGIKKHITLSGHGQLQYSAMVNFSTANLISSNNGRDFTIEIEAPYIDMNSIKLAQNSLVMNDSDYSFFANKKDGAQAQKLYMDSFVDSGTNKIIEEYNTKAKQNYLEKIAKTEVHNLVRALNLEGNVNIYVKIIK